MPCDLGRLGAVLSEDYPGVIFGEREVDLWNLKQLTGGHDGKGHAETVQLVTCDEIENSESWGKGWNFRRLTHAPVR